MPIDTKQLTTAVEKTQTTVKKGFLQSLDLIVNLRDINPKSGVKLNETVELPHGVGKAVKICIIGSGQIVSEARKLQVDLVLQRPELEALGHNKKGARKLAEDMGAFICEASLMPLVGRSLGSFLGPRGKMPTPIPPNAPLEPVIEKLRKTVRVRMKDQPVVQCRVGTEDMSIEQLSENIQSVFRVLEAKLERGVRNIHSLYLKKTMGPPVVIPFAGVKR